MEPNHKHRNQKHSHTTCQAAIIFVTQLVNNGITSLDISLV